MTTAWSCALPHETTRSGCHREVATYEPTESDTICHITLARLRTNTPQPLLLFTISSQSCSHFSFCCNIGKRAWSSLTTKSNKTKVIPYMRAIWRWWLSMRAILIKTGLLISRQGGGWCSYLEGHIHVHLGRLSFVLSFSFFTTVRVMVSFRNTTHHAHGVLYYYYSCHLLGGYGSMVIKKRNKTKTHFYCL